MLSRSKQDYLKALYALGAGGEVVSTSDLATRLSVSPPSVTHMLGRLDDAGLVRHRPRGGARLTESGRRAALGIVRRHRILETFLVRVLGLDWSEVHEDAEVLEHHISDRVLEAIDRLIGHPVEDPHGHPIPDRRGRVRMRSLMPLTAVPAGRRAIVREVRGADAARMARWKAVGLVPGASFAVRAVRDIDSVMEIDVGRRRLVLGLVALEGLWVELAKGVSHAL